MLSKLVKCSDEIAKKHMLFSYKNLTSAEIRIVISVFNMNNTEMDKKRRNIDSIIFVSKGILIYNKELDSCLGNL
jgi:hypothetical protein